jgi:ribosomal protein L3
MFDYVSTTSGRGNAGAIERFAILVTHQHWGAVIEEAQPPHTLH